MDNGTDDGTRALSVLDRHALVMSIWLAIGFVALALLARGFREGGMIFVFGGFGTVIAGFVGHVITNAVTCTRFTSREIALGLVVYALALIGFLLALLVGSEAVLARFVPLSIGFLALAVVVVFYMVTHFGTRGAFRAFDVIRDFGPDADQRRDTGG